MVGTPPAASVAPAEHRTAAEQINYWARLGMQVDRSGTITNRRVRSVAAAEAQLAGLDPEERAAAHAVIDASIGAAAGRERFGPAARTAGRASVSLDDDGNLIEIAADGTRRVLESP